jgi:hypothetical protein
VGIFEIMALEEISRVHAVKPLILHGPKLLHQVSDYSFQQALTEE